MVKIGLIELTGLSIHLKSLKNLRQGACCSFRRKGLPSPKFFYDLGINFKIY